MNITFHSTVIITQQFDTMKSFYKELLKQEIVHDFGTCISFASGLSIWKLSEEDPLSKKLGRTFDASGNKNIELCFETEEIIEVEKLLYNYSLEYLHRLVEEKWGQRTIRFFDPDGNLIEVGESIPCFIRRMYGRYKSLEEVSKRSSVPLDMVREICCKGPSSYNFY